MSADLVARLRDQRIREFNAAMEVREEAADALERCREETLEEAARVADSRAAAYRKRERHPMVDEQIVRLQAEETALGLAAAIRALKSAGKRKPD